MRFSFSKIRMIVASLALLALIIPMSSAPLAARSHPQATPTDEPTIAPITYTTIDGTWEVQLQPGSTTLYSHFNIPSSADGIQGSWLRDKVQTPFEGSQTGDHFVFSGSDAKGPFTLSGYIENSAAMIGQFTQGQHTVPFTATHQGLPLAERPAKVKHHRHRP